MDGGAVGRRATRRAASHRAILLAWLGFAFGWLGLDCVLGWLGLVFCWLGLNGLGLAVVVQGCPTRRVASRRAT